MKVKGSVTTEGKKVPYPFKNAVEMLEMAGKSGLSIAEMKRVNEETHMSREELDAGLDAHLGAPCRAASTVACRRTASCRAA